MRLADMTVSSRLQFGFAIILAILAIVAGVAILKVRTIETSLLANSQENTPFQSYATDF